MFKFWFREQCQVSGIWVGQNLSGMNKGTLTIACHNNLNIMNWDAFIFYFGLY
jgi:hypothetical protein